MTHSTLLAIDVGGTSIEASVFDFETGAEYYKVSLETERGKARLVTSLETVYQDAVRELETTGATKRNTNGKTKTIQAISLGMPGKFSPPDYRLEQGSATNLEHYPGEFSGLSILELCKEAFSESIPCYIVNDAIAQFMGAVFSVTTEKRQSLVGEKLGYIGIGTGLGGGFGCLKTEDDLTIYTDGHISEMILANGQTSEEMISGPALAKDLELSLEDLNSDKALLERYKASFDPLIEALRELLEGINQGRSQKAATKTWSETENELIKGTSHFFLGGGLGQKGLISEYLKAQCDDYFREKDLPIHIELIPNAKKAALLGLYYHYQEELSKESSSDQEVETTQEIEKGEN